MANLFLSMLGAVAQLERKLIGERQREGYRQGQGKRVPRQEAKPDSGEGSRPS